MSARTVRYLHTIIGGVLGQAVKDSLLIRNPAAAATPPTAKEAKAPEMHPWDAGELAAFLAWAEGAAQNYALWNTLAMTGMRRGEALALRWRDVDFDAATISVRRSAGMVRIVGEGADVVEGDTKSGKPRVVDLDDGAAAVLRAWKRERGSTALQLVTPARWSSVTSRASAATPSTSPDSSPVTLSASARCPRSGSRPAPRPRYALAARPRAGTCGQPAPRPRLADGDADGLRPRDARQPARDGEYLRSAGEGGARSMTRVSGASQHPKKANDKLMTWGFNVSEGGLEHGNR